MEVTNNKNIFGTDYENGYVDFSSNVNKPSYEVALNWMKAIEHPNVTLDFWARGNYSRRLIFNKINEIHPIIIPVRNVGEMNWAYKRLALINLPVEFTVIGNLTKPSKVLHLCPADIEFDSGWGYMGALGTIKKIRNREYFPVIGNARLLPEHFAKWIVDEVPHEFIEGKVFVSPANLVGIDENDYHNGIRILSDISNGTIIEENERIAESVLSLDIPFVDNISIAKLRKILTEFEPELIRFRQAFRELINLSNDSRRKTNFYIEQLNYEITEILKAEKNQGFRDVIKKNGGVLTLLTAAFPIADVISNSLSSTSSLLQYSTAGALCGAASILAQIWKQHKNEKANLKRNPFYLLWQLGLDKPHIKKRYIVHRNKLPKKSILDLEVNSSFHWLTPPKNGLGFLAVKK